MFLHVSRHLTGAAMDTDLAIGELAKQAGVSVETVRFYERIGLMPPPMRTKQGRRTYQSGDVRTLAFIRRARELNFSLVDVRALLALRGPDNECADVKEIAGRHLERVRAELRRAEEVERILSAAVEQCCGGSTAACSVLKVLETTGV